MAFASWYSLRKRLPDWEVVLELNLDKPLFQWASRLGVKISKQAGSEIKIGPTVVAVRDFEGNFDIASSKSSIQSMLVDYSEGCGNFVLKEWIDRSDIPFYRALKRFGTSRLTVNEMAVLNLWEQCNNVYLHAGGS
jgi:hypothetical protein